MCNTQFWKIKIFKFNVSLFFCKYLLIYFNFLFLEQAVFHVALLYISFVFLNIIKVVKKQVYHYTEKSLSSNLVLCSDCLFIFPVLLPLVDGTFIQIRRETQHEDLQASFIWEKTCLVHVFQSRNSFYYKVNYQYADW